MCVYLVNFYDDDWLCSWGPEEVYLLCFLHSGLLWTKKQKGYCKENMQLH